MWRTELPRQRWALQALQATLAPTSWAVTTSVAGARRCMINEVGKHQSCMVSLFAGGSSCTVATTQSLLGASACAGTVAATCEFMPRRHM